jgi:hypothetical protein
MDHGNAQSRSLFGSARSLILVKRWQANQKLRWTPEEIEDVVYFLSTTRYFFTTSVGAHTIRSSGPLD